MTGFASTLSATSAASAFAAPVSVAARSSSKYLPCLTSATPSYPSECRASAITLPWGSKTDGLSVTKTRARMRLGPHRMKNAIEDVVDVLQLLVEVERALDFSGGQHARHVGVGQQQRLEIALLLERAHGVPLHPVVRLFARNAFPRELEQHRP